MLIQLERVSAQRIRATELRCTVPRCNAGATWQLIDRDMPAFHAANGGERLCCAAHITVTYLNLRGADVVSRAATVRPGLGYGIGRRRKPKRISISPQEVHTKR